MVGLLGFLRQWAKLFANLTFMVCSGDFEGEADPSEPKQDQDENQALAHSGRDAKDSFSDEKFGSSDTASENRAEEQRKGRASFELSRKQPPKAFHERQKLKPEGQKRDLDVTELLEDSEDDKGRPDTTKKVSEPQILPASNIPTRPVVCPGFASTILGRKQGAKSSNDKANLSYGLNLRKKNKESAPATETAEWLQKSISLYQKFRSTCETAEEASLQMLRHQLRTLPDPCGVEEYEKRPVEEFGVFLLSHYGWKPGMAIGKKHKQDGLGESEEKDAAHDDVNYKKMNLPVLMVSADDFKGEADPSEPKQAQDEDQALAHSGRDTKDSFSDETFGSSDTASEDSAEEQRKERVSIEFSRKQRQIAFGEGQELKSEGHKYDLDYNPLNLVAGLNKLKKKNP